MARYEELGQVELIQDGNLVIDPEVWGGVVSTFREMYTLGYMVNREDDASAMFLGGNLAFYEAGTWTNATLMQVEGLNYDCIMMPVFSPETAAVSTPSPAVR